jgi:hypothetical protein
MERDVPGMTKGRHVPVGPDKQRKTLTLPKTLVARVRAFRHRHQHDQESDAYVALLEKALDADEREEQKPERKR